MVLPDVSAMVTGEEQGEGQEGTAREWLALRAAGTDHLEDNVIAAEVELPADSDPGLDSDFTECDSDLDEDALYGASLPPRPVLELTQVQLEY